MRRYATTLVFFVIAAMGPGCAHTAGLDSGDHLTQRRRLGPTTHYDPAAGANCFGLILALIH